MIFFIIYDISSNQIVFKYIIIYQNGKIFIKLNISKIKGNQKTNYKKQEKIKLRQHCF